MATNGSYDDDRDAFLESSRRCQEALAAACTEHNRCVLSFLAVTARIEAREDELQESVDKLQAIVLEQQVDLTAVMRELRELRAERGGA